VAELAGISACVGPVYDMNGALNDQNTERAALPFGGGSAKDFKRCEVSRACVWS